MEGFLKFTYEIKLKYHGVAPPFLGWCRTKWMEIKNGIEVIGILSSIAMTSTYTSKNDATCLKIKAKIKCPLM